MQEKLILDPCCGSKMMWFNRNHPNVIYTDKRSEEHILCDGRALEVKPDIQCDITSLPFADESFYLIAADLPHMEKLGANSWMALKYGILPKNWQPFIRDAFNEMWRCLKPNGTLIFKWNEDQIPVKKIIEAIGHEPLFGHPTRHSKTIWLAFMKISQP